jgi:hypothetical protein
MQDRLSALAELLFKFEQIFSALTCAETCPGSSDPDENLRRISPFSRAGPEDS